MSNYCNSGEGHCALAAIGDYAQNVDVPLTLKPKQYQLVSLELWSKNSIMTLRNVYISPLKFKRGRKKMNQLCCVELNK